MGAKTWIVVYADRDVPEVLSGEPDLDRKASLQLANLLFPKEQHEPRDDEELTFACPTQDELLLGCFPGVSIVAATDFLIDYPSKLESRFLEYGATKTVTMHTMHSVTDWFAFARWERGELLRSLSLSPDSGVIEDIGEKMDFELPFWNGERAMDDVDTDPEDRYPLPFHPLELGEQAVRSLFGYQLEGVVDPKLVRSESITLARYSRIRPSRWKFWK